MKRFQILLPLLAALLALVSCQNAPSSSSASGETPAPADTARVEQARTAAFQARPFIEPVQLTGVETRVQLPISADSVSPPPGIQAILEDGGQALAITVVGDIGHLSVLRLWQGSEPVDLLLRQPPPPGREVTLRLRDQGYQSVSVKGAMNDWEPAPMKQNNGIWEHTFKVPPGDYPYLFVVDGREMRDPKNPKSVANGRGGLHSLLSLQGGAEGKPARLSFVEADDTGIRVEMSQPGAVLAFWENQQLAVTREGNFFSFSIPDQAAAQPASSIRVYGQNESGPANELSIPLESGRISAEFLKNTQ